MKIDKSFFGGDMRGTNRWTQKQTPKENLMAANVTPEDVIFGVIYAHKKNGLFPEVLARLVAERLELLMRRQNWGIAVRYGPQISPGTSGLIFFEDNCD